jgi:hypothetical protein
MSAAPGSRHQALDAAATQALAAAYRVLIEAARRSKREATDADPEAAARRAETNRESS